MKLTKPMNQDLDVERSILKEILIRNSVLSTVLSLDLNADDFSDGHHRIIFQAYCKLSENKSPITIITLTAQLRLQSQYEEVNSSNRLTSMFTDGFSIGNVSAYVQILKSHCIIRKMTGPDT